MKFVYNPGNTSVVYDDDGRMVAPREWQYVDPAKSRVNKLIEQGRLIEVAVPERLPENTQPDALPVLNEAINDQSANDVPEDSEIVEAAPEDSENSEDDSVRNTGTQSRRSSNRKAKNEEA